MERATDHDCRVFGAFGITLHRRSACCSAGNRLLRGSLPVTSTPAPAMPVGWNCHFTYPAPGHRHGAIPTYRHRALCHARQVPLVGYREINLRFGRQHRAQAAIPTTSPVSMLLKCGALPPRHHGFHQDPAHTVRAWCGFQILLMQRM